MCAEITHHPRKQPREILIRECGLRDAGNLHEVMPPWAAHRKRHERLPQRRHLARSARAVGKMASHALEHIGGLHGRGRHEGLLRPNRRAAKQQQTTRALEGENPELTDPDHSATPTMRAVEQW